MNNRTITNRAFKEAIANLTGNQSSIPVCANDNDALCVSVFKEWMGKIDGSSGSSGGSGGSGLVLTALGTAEGGIDSFEGVSITEAIINVYNAVSSGRAASIILKIYDEHNGAYQYITTSVVNCMYSSASREGMLIANAMVDSGDNIVSYTLLVTDYGTPNIDIVMRNVNSDD